MDILTQIDSLSDDQLRTLALRDDATGVLAEYRLAALRGLPAPLRTTVVMGDGYAIVAANGEIVRVPVESVSKIIRQEEGEYCVYSEDGSRSFGCYPTMEQAQERLQQIHSFSNAREGSFVSWNSSGGRARGQVEYVMREGVLGIPDSDFSINAEPDDPAVLIRVWRDTTEGWQPTETLVGHKMSTLTDIEPLNKESYEPPKGVQEAGQRALDWIAEGHAGSGFTDVGRARAAQLARGDNVSRETIGRMASYFARHEVDSQAEGWNLGEEGFPSPGRVAWEAWGGDPGKTWADSIMARTEKNGVPLSPTQNLLYEALEIVTETFGKFDTGVGENGAHYMTDNPFAAQGIKCSNCVFYQGGGGCEILSVPVAPEAVCKFWVIPENLIAEDEPVELAKARFVRKADEKKFTLGPLYVPDFMDAHGEWTDAEELQNAVWGWVKSGDRRIFLQHDREVEAGEWVEVMTMPQPWKVNMLAADGSVAGEVTYPAGTVFLGVHWNDEAWADIKAGKLRGYSIGGMSGTVYADMPDGAIREGIEVPA